MEKDTGSCFQQQHCGWQLANLNSLRVPSDLGQQDTVPTYMGPCTNLVPANRGLPVFPCSQQLHSKASQSNEPQSHGWFNCLPRYHLGLTPLPSSVLKERVPIGPHEKRVEAVTPNLVSGCAQKRFLVFDQSGDQTTLIFSSGIGTPVNCPTSWMPKPPSASMLNKDEVGIKMDNIRHSGPNFSDENNENHGDYSGSEMREDTEELNALLYSDDDDNYSEDDEETSTGHSPSTMTAYEREEWSDENAEEVDSCVETMKRRKLLDGGFDISSLVDRESSVKTNRCCKHEDDAESSCAEEKNESQDFTFPVGDNRLKKEKIRETVSILQNIVPGGKGKEAIVVLEEAINYLKSLKRKAKALGLDTL